MSSDAKQTAASAAIMNSKADSHSSSKIRVRLLIAIPATIVLLLTVFAASIYWVVESGLGTTGSRPDPAQFQEFSRDWLMLLAFFVVGGALLGYAMANSLTLPIRNIIKLSERIAAGDLSTKIDLARSDELGQLGSSFNSMVESLNSFFEVRNRFIMESFSGGLLTIDRNGTITAMNSAAEKILGLNQGYKHIGKPASEVLKLPGLESLHLLAEEALWKEEPVNDREIEVRVVADSQGRYQTRRLSVNINPMRDMDGKIFGMILNFRNLQDLQVFYEQLKNADRLATMGTFSAGLAHEIRNPLGSIKGTAQLLAEDLKGREQETLYLNVILKEVDRLDRLVREVQSYSQPSAEKQIIKLGRLLEDTVKLVRTQPMESLEKMPDIILNLEVLPDIFGEHERLVQALMNILINAIHAAGPHGEVKVEAWAQDEGELPVHIRIENTGPAISADIMDKIFEPFFTTKSNGTGLGLSITYQIVKNHGGAIQVHNEERKVVFTVRLPLK